MTEEIHCHKETIIHYMVCSADSNDTNIASKYIACIIVMNICHPVTENQGTAHKLRPRLFYLLFSIVTCYHLDKLWIIIAVLILLI